MLALRRLRCLLHSVPSSQTRHLRTQPREIPLYTRQWDPSRHRPFSPTTQPNEAYEPRPNAREPGLPRDFAYVQHDATGAQSAPQNIVIQRTSREPQTNECVRQLEYLLGVARTRQQSISQNSNLRVNLWETYTQAKTLDPELTTYIPEGAWDVLWKSEHAELSDMARRQDHLAELDRDILTAKIPRTSGQVMYHVERQFMAGKEEQALGQWHDNHRDFATKPEYLDLGARLYALAGNADRAREIMDELFEQFPNWDLSLMIAVFRAHTSSDLKKHHKTAKDIYLNLKNRLGTGATIETFDACLIGFLEARSLSPAKEVFRDMVRGGYLGPESHVNDVLRRLHLLYTLGTDISSMTSIALDAIAVLPEAYHSHIFGDWMKTAVTEKAPQAAAQILDLMIQRGYEPEAFHFNMLLRALFRTKEPSDVLKAENLGWKMIEEARLLMRKDRPTPQARTKDIGRRLKDVSVLDANPTIAVPAASVSTFALVMHHHARNLQWEHVDYLTRQLKLASIEPNTTIMNVLIDNKCRQAKFTEAWQIYKSLTDNADAATVVFPDGESIRCLWKTLRIALAHPAARDSPNLPTPRELLHETIQWWTLCRSRYDAGRFLQGLAAEDHGAITALVLHCFSFAQDLAGSLVALHVLRQNFGFRPTKKAAEIVQRQIAWVDMREETESVRMQFGFSKNNAKSLEGAARAYRQLRERRTTDLKITTDTLGDYSEEYMGDLELNVLSELIRTALIANYPPEAVEAMVDAARNAVGLPDLPTGDLTAFELV
ncbi:hypothetical protein EKO04_002465 [Ascochyta lentis]|uniref:Pentatricopeptide repeat-containing protein n=1 Tax=Ascochyta lentis TaxID=205686 RepID=A0A8H7MM92_9PLEO|nr:hypothetical protein EKO04_002465 [Ascochyta lentis]